MKSSLPHRSKNLFVTVIYWYWNVFFVQVYFTHIPVNQGDPTSWNVYIEDMYSDAFMIGPLPVFFACLLWKDYWWIPVENKKLFKHHIFSTYTWSLGSHELSEQDSFWLAGVFSYALVMSKMGTCILSLCRGYYDPLIVSFNLRQSFDLSYQFYMWRLVRLVRGIKALLSQC